jgi:hypothetical protein
MLTQPDSGQGSDRVRGFRKASILVAAAAAALVGRPAEAASGQSSAAVALLCESAAGGAKARLDPAAACASFARIFSAALGRPVIVVTPAAFAKATEHIHLTIRHPRQDAVEAVAKGRLRGRDVVAGPIAIDVMDRALRQSDVDNLARRMARALTSR